MYLSNNEKGNIMFEIKKRGAKPIYPWEKLQEVGDYFLLPDATEKVAKSVRATSKYHGIKVSVLALVQGGYIVKRVS